MKVKPLREEHQLCSIRLLENLLRKYSKHQLCVHAYHDRTLLVWYSISASVGKHSSQHPFFGAIILSGFFRYQRAAVLLTSLACLTLELREQGRKRTRRRGCLRNLPAVCECAQPVTTSITRKHEGPQNLTGIIPPERQITNEAVWLWVWRGQRA